MTNAEKLKKIEEVLEEYQGKESVFAEPAQETAQQKEFREDLRAVVSILFKEDADISPELSVAEIKKRLQKIWEKVKPEEWK